MSTGLVKEIRIAGMPAYAQRQRNGDIQFRFTEDHVWFWPSREHWQSLTPESLRAIADLKDAR